MTKQEAFLESIKRDNIQSADYSVDYALPQPWVEKQSQLHDIPAGQITGNLVWLYDKKSPVFGRPYPITALGQLILAQIDTWAR